jgi:hypothetical protein
MVRDETEKNENKTQLQYFQAEDDAFPLATYTGQPEFATFDRGQYNVNSEEELPAVSFSTNMGVNELPPLPSDHTL